MGLNDTNYGKKDYKNIVHAGDYYPNLLDNASEMFSKWGITKHMDEKKHLFERSGRAPKTGDSDALKKEKEALRCVCEKMMDAKLNRKDAAVIIKNFNEIEDPGFE